ncbi:MAG: AAA family ATPase [Desulfobacteraceae bacterium]|nr:AAA family ATPase [Desulfobacteraceae bacterium]
MYLDYYSLKHKPFQINTDPRFLWLGEKHREALATLKYGIRDNKGFLLLTGEIGTGKTTLINALLSSMEENVVVATMSDPALSRLEFFQYIATAFGIQEPVASKVDFLLHFSRFLQQTADSGKKVLLIIDEAQRLTHELLEEIRLLSNIENQQAKLLNIFFVGQTELNQVLEDPRNKALRQRISVNYHIPTLTEAEVGDYIRHRLLVAGSRRPLFTGDAVHQAHLFSAGFPRLVNIICDRALLTGYVEDLKQIKGKIVKECARELELPQAPGRAAGNRWWGGRSRTEMKAAGAARWRWRPAILGVPALAVATGLVFFNTGARDNRGDIKEKVAQVATGLAVGSGGPAGEQAGSASEGQKKSPAPARKEAAGRKNGQGPAGRMKAVDPAGVTAPGKLVAAAATGSAVEKKKGAPAAAGEMPAATSQGTGPTGEAAAAGGAGDTPLHHFKINFKIDSNELSPGSLKELERLVRLMREHQELSAVVTGFTDTSGFYHYNKKISESRADTVKSFLIGRGVPAHRIQTMGRGPEDPVASNETVEGREANRRVEIKLVKGG